MMTVILSSFGFKYGVPISSTLLLDVRFLPNPYWEEELREKTGMEKEVSEYVISSPEGRAFLKLLKKFILFMVQQNIAAGREDMEFAVGCTGGRHRSVAIAEVLKDVLLTLPVELSVIHRDIEKDIA